MLVGRPARPKTRAVCAYVTLAIGARYARAARRRRARRGGGGATGSNICFVGRVAPGLPKRLKQQLTRTQRRCRARDVVQGRPRRALKTRVHACWSRDPVTLCRTQTIHLLGITFRETIAAVAITSIHAQHTSSGIAFHTLHRQPLHAPALAELRLTSRCPTKVLSGIVNPVLPLRCRLGAAAKLVGARAPPSPI